MLLEEYLKKHYCSSTAKAYYREIILFLANLTTAPKATYKELTEYIGRLRLRYQNPKTIKRTVAAIKVYYSYLVDSEIREDNPAKSIRLRDRLSNDIQLQELFTQQELESLLEKRCRYRLLESRNKVLLSLLIHQAPLVLELERLKVEDIDLEGGSIIISGTAKTHRRVLPLKSKQIMLVYGYLKECRPKLLCGKESDLFFVGNQGAAMQGEEMSKLIKRNYENCFESRKVTAQSIRQSVIANLLKSGKELRIVQTFAGHKYPGATERYCQSNTEALKSAICRCHPMR